VTCGPNTRRSGIIKSSHPESPTQECEKKALNSPSEEGVSKDSTEMKLEDAGSVLYVTALKSIINGAKQTLDHSPVHLTHCSLDFSWVSFNDSAITPEVVGRRRRCGAPALTPHRRHALIGAGGWSLVLGAFSSLQEGRVSVSSTTGAAKTFGRTRQSSRNAVVVFTAAPVVADRLAPGMPL